MKMKPKNMNNKDLLMNFVSLTGFNPSKLKDEKFKEEYLSYFDETLQRMQNDRLFLIFDSQITLDTKIMKEKNIEEINPYVCILAMFSEVNEILNEFNWKAWKDYKGRTLDKDKLSEEIADLLHFVIQLCWINGIFDQDLFSAYMNKNKVNHIRQDTGY